MNLNIKNERLIPLFEEHQKQSERDAREWGGGLSDAESAQMGKWYVEHPEAILYGYVESLMDVSERKGIRLDLTYDTLANLPAAIVALYSFQKKHTLEAGTNIPMRDEVNKEIAYKTIAAYLTLLAMNEHNFWFSTLTTRQKNMQQYPWGGFVSVRTGKKRNVDLHYCCQQAAESSCVLPAQGGMCIQVSPIIAEYEKMTGVRLTDHGLKNIFVV